MGIMSLLSTFFDSFKGACDYVCMLNSLKNHRIVNVFLSSGAQFKDNRGAKSLFWVGTYPVDRQASSTLANAALRTRPLNLFVSSFMFQTLMDMDKSPKHFYFHTGLLYRQG